MAAAPAPSRAAGTTTRRVATMRPPSGRPLVGRAHTATPVLNGRASPAESLASAKSRTPKRKAQTEAEADSGESRETNINVVVRCRGRNDREVRENSGVVVSTDGISGKKVTLSMGPSALSNKEYQFDKVFSPAADQGMVFDEVVLPILDEVLAGFNCTIFAYGQTGTGKTYTMSGDITDVQPIPEAAGIIPRVLHSLFDKLDGTDADKAEHTVKCSFIELYNEELRDLLSTEDVAKLKIFDETNKNGRSTMLVQGMEESHITNASKGIRLLREGSHKRQVAATKCNDLSSRSHTVFTITVYIKRISESGEEYVSSGKLNLVDLAGSENIQRSGAENKRAAEAGVINKSLLTLGRVINALVDKGSHIPYRESKLTRLLQDSLGGRTKTCIIATLSPAKSNLEETISTLDYAFRAKNIRNKPQINQMLSKKTLFREFTAEIEKLKSELIATRQRNGVYLSTESYEELTTESESRRILSEEQRDKIATVETNLRNKVQELFNLNMNFQALRRDNDQTRLVFESTKNVLEQTELILAHTKKTLAEETSLRKAHQETEEKLTQVGQDLLGTLETTTNHVDRLHSKLRRRSELQSLNRDRWAETRGQILNASSSVEARMETLRSQQEGLISTLSTRMKAHVAEEVEALQSSRKLLNNDTAAFVQSETEVNAQTAKAKDDMNLVLEEIITLREHVKHKVGAGLDDLSTAAQRISAGIATELETFHQEMQDGFVSLGREFKTLFEDLIGRMHEQQVEADRLRQEMEQANARFLEMGQENQRKLHQAMEEEKEKASDERAALLANIANLINDSASAQDSRRNSSMESANKRIKTSEDEYRVAQQSYSSGMDRWSVDARSLINASTASRDTIKSRLQTDWNKADAQTSKLIETTTHVHGDTVRIVASQMSQMDGQLNALDDILGRVRSQNEEHHEAHTTSLAQLIQNVQSGYRRIGQHVETTYGRAETLSVDVEQHHRSLLDTLECMSTHGEALQPLRELCEDAGQTAIAEYVQTGETPARVQYSYPTVLPRTEAPASLLEKLREPGDGQRSVSPRKSPNKRSPAKQRSSPIKAPSSPCKTTVFADAPPRLLMMLPPVASAPLTRAQSETVLPGLRERNVNVAAAGYTAHADTQNSSDAETRTKGGPLRRQNNSNPLSQSAFDAKSADKHKARATVAGMADGRENVPMRSSLSASVGPGSGGRRPGLRSRGSD